MSLVVPHQVLGESARRSGGDSTLHLAGHLCPTEAVKGWTRGPHVPGSSSLRGLQESADQAGKELSTAPGSSEQAGRETGRKPRAAARGQDSRDSPQGSVCKSARWPQRPPRGHCISPGQVVALFELNIYLARTHSGATSVNKAFQSFLSRDRETMNVSGHARCCEGRGTPGTRMGLPNKEARELASESQAGVQDEPPERPMHRSWGRKTGRPESQQAHRGANCPSPASPLRTVEPGLDMIHPTVSRIPEVEVSSMWASLEAETLGAHGPGPGGRPERTSGVGGGYVGRSVQRCFKGNSVLSGLGVGERGRRWPPVLCPSSREMDIVAEGLSSVLLSEDSRACGSSPVAQHTSPASVKKGSCRGPWLPLSGPAPGRAVPAVGGLLVLQQTPAPTPNPRDNSV